MASLAKRAKTAELAKKSSGGIKRARQQDRGPLTEYLAFCLGGDVYATPVSLVREILKPPPLTPLPRAPNATMGIISVRGQLVTVIDLRKRLRLTEGPMTRKTRILLIDATGGETLGVYVDEVLQVVRLAEAEIEHAATALGGEIAGYIAGIARPAASAAPARSIAGSASDAALLILLDLKSVLAN